ncbi:Holliday junction branch migration protein RuvA [Desulfatirhabdium butyrativorans]|uniref:Holliday junction branch migration protein RuvA n=1 Tax=Desulfatirhabdium butyrativorans TaxID=340467 RepID=UPI000413A825|nr:Holliday junction branch migration protein RuvA [Desulfatirhabdium butyrativorans]
MIGYLEGKILQKDEDRVLVLVNHVGYEVYLPAVVMKALSAKLCGDDIHLYISYQQSERQPKPMLIGFVDPVEKEFFQQFISVEDIGPAKGMKAMTLSVAEIAAAIEQNDVRKLQTLKGIGPRTAQKIVASLKGKVLHFVENRPEKLPEETSPDDILAPVMTVLVEQLGHKPADARLMIADALKRNSTIQSPEALLEEVIRGKALS